MRSLVLLFGCGVLALVLLLGRSPTSGPEPIAYGRDTCDGCHMHLSQPGFAGELRDKAGKLTRYDDLGCLLHGMWAMHAEVPEAWVEDHGGGGFVALVEATYVGDSDVQTPMGSGLLAFADPARAQAFADAHRGRTLSLEQVLREAAEQGPHGGAR